MNFWNAMTLKNWATVALSAFLGGAGGYVTTHLSDGSFLMWGATQWKAFGIGAAMAGLAAIVHLFQSPGGGPPGPGVPVTKLPTANGANGPVPPAAARLRLRWVPAIALGLAVSACLPSGAPTPQTVQDVTIGLNGAICVLTTYATDIGEGKSQAVAVADAAIKCGVSIVQASGVLDAHRKAMVSEGYVVRPNDAGAE